MAMVNWLYGVTLRHVKHQLVFQLQRQSLIVLNVGSFITIRNTLFFLFVLFIIALAYYLSEIKLIQN